MLLSPGFMREYFCERRNFRAFVGAKRLNFREICRASIPRILANCVCVKIRTSSTVGSGIVCCTTYMSIQSVSLSHNCVCSLCFFASATKIDVGSFLLLFFDLKSFHTWWRRKVHNVFEKRAIIEQMIDSLVALNLSDNASSLWMIPRCTLGPKVTQLGVRFGDPNVQCHHTYHSQHILIFRSNVSSLYDAISWLGDASSVERRGGR